MKKLLFLALVLILTALTFQLSAQSLISGDIAGVVTDPSGAVIAGRDRDSQEPGHRRHPTPKRQRPENFASAC